MATTTEIAPDLFRISIFAPFWRPAIQSLPHSRRGAHAVSYRLRGMFPGGPRSCSKLIRIEDLRHIGFSHFESDECGALNEWLAEHPKRMWFAARSELVTVNDFIGREARAVTEGDVFHRKISLPLCAYAAPASWLGRWNALRGNTADTVMLRSFSSNRRRGASDPVGRGGVS